MAFETVVLWVGVYGFWLGVLAYIFFLAWVWDD